MWRTTQTSPAGPTSRCSLIRSSCTPAPFSALTSSTACGRGKPPCRARMRTHFCGIKHPPTPSSAHPASSHPATTPCHMPGIPELPPGIAPPYSCAPACLRPAKMTIMMINIIRVPRPHAPPEGKQEMQVLSRKESCARLPCPHAGMLSECCRCLKIRKGCARASRRSGVACAGSRSALFTASSRRTSLASAALRPAASGSCGAACHACRQHSPSPAAAALAGHLPSPDLSPQRQPTETASKADGQLIDTCSVEYSAWADATAGRHACMHAVARLVALDRGEQPL